MCLLCSYNYLCMSVLGAMLARTALWRLLTIGGRRWGPRVSPSLSLSSFIDDEDYFIFWPYVDITGEPRFVRSPLYAIESVCIRRDALGGAVPDVVTVVMTVSPMSLPGYCEVGTHVMCYRPDRVLRQFGLCQGVVFRSESLVSGSLYSYCHGGFSGVGSEVVHLAGPREGVIFCQTSYRFGLERLGSFYPIMRVYQGA